MRKLFCFFGFHKFGYYNCTGYYGTRRCAVCFYKEYLEEFYYGGTESYEWRPYSELDM